LTQFGIAGKGKRIFFNGEHSVTGWVWLTPLTFLIKMPLSFLAMILVGFMCWRNHKDLWVYAGFSLFLILFFSIFTRVNAGVRYLFPALPCLALLSGCGLASLVRGGWFMKSVAAGLLVWLAAADLAIHPHQLCYANEAAGGPKKLYRLLADSNVDWGQDLPSLAEVMEAQGIPRVRLSYFGSDDPAQYGIQYDALPSIGLRPDPGALWWFEKGSEEKFDLEPGVYAISANNLNGLFFKDPNLYKTFRERKPDFRAGYSILLYEYPFQGD
jgi:hypothetical protein